MNENVRDVWLFRVDRLEQRSCKVYVRGIGRDATFAERPLGWFATCGSVTFELGPSQPDLRVGDVLELRKREP